MPLTSAAASVTSAVSSPPQATLLPILSRDLPQVCRFLHAQLNRRISPEAWQMAFSQPWMTNPPNFGCMLVHAGEVVGVFGAIHSEQMIRGKLEKFRNQNSWVVLEPFRSQSGALMRALDAQPGYHVTITTPNRKVTEIFLSKGFRAMDPRVTVIPNLPWLRARQAELLTEPERILTRLPSDAARNYQNHAAFPWIHQLALGDAHGWCHVVFRVGRWKRLPAAKLLHIDCAETFLRLYPALGRHLLARHRIATLHLPTRLLPRTPQFSFQILDRQPRIFLSDRLHDRDLTYLYTEMVSLDMPL